MAERRDGKGRTGGVQSIERAFGLLEMMADAGGRWACPARHRLRPAAADDPPAGAHAGRPRLRAAGAVPAVRAGPRADPARRESAASSAPGRGPTWPSWSTKSARRANMAMLDGDQIVYLAQVPSPALDADVHRGRAAGASALHGRRQGDPRPLPETEVRELLQRTGMPKHTDNTITTPDAFTPRSTAARTRVRDGRRRAGSRSPLRRGAVPDVPPRSPSRSPPAA